ncbi:MAG: DNA-binding protein [Desulfobacteraceae bacterium]|nr:MAG: DNA-binding protein [Desulfobacteraceae bacterium]
MLLVKEEEAARILKEEVATLRAWRRAGVGPSFYIIAKRVCRYDVAKLKEFQKQETGPEAQRAGNP